MKRHTAPVGIGTRPSPARASSGPQPADLRRVRRPPLAARWQPTTIEGYERRLRLHIVPTLGAMPLGDIRADAVQNLYESWLRRMQETMALPPNT